MPFDMGLMEFMLWAVYAHAICFAVASIARLAFAFPWKAKSRELQSSRYLIAYLRGGRNLVLQAALTNLINTKVVNVSAHDEMQLMVPRTQLDDPIEQTIFAVLQVEGRTRFQVMKERLAGHLDEFDHELRSSGMLVSPRGRLLATFAPFLISVAIPIVAIFRVLSEREGSDNGSFLLFFAVVAGIVSTMVYLYPPHRSWFGSAVLRRLQRQHAALKTPPYGLDDVSKDQLALTVGLFGLDVLETTVLSSLPYKFRTNPQRQYAWRGWFWGASSAPRLEPGEKPDPTSETKEE